MPRKNNDSGKSVEAHVHKKDKRANIPTRELADFVVAEEQAPYHRLYPRDPSLDPQLVWKGKDEQDAKSLEVPTVPIYIQEKIAPQAIIEDLRAHPFVVTASAGSRGKPEPAKAGTTSQPTQQLNLFADFNGIEFDQLVDFYRHEQNWSNRMILGDSLLVMNSLAEKEGLKGKVQMIYLDPPYGIKFGSNWQVSTRKRDVKDGKAEDATRQPEQIRAFRDTWKLGIHSYLAYLRERLVVARELLTESGSIFVQIGDENVHLVRCLMDEVFGSENFVSIIQFVTTGGQTTVGPAPVTDFLLWFAKEKPVVKYRPLLTEQERKSLAPTISWYVENKDGEIRALERHEIGNPSSLSEGTRLLWLADLLSRSGGESSQFAVVFRGGSFVPTRGGWRTGQRGIERLIKASRLYLKGNTLLFRRYLDDYPFTPLNALWLDTQMGGFAAKDKIYVVQTHSKVVERCLLMTTDPGDLVLDPTCGSGTTTCVAEQWGRRWITVDTSRVALALARTRLMAAKFPYYLLSDSPEGAAKEADLSGRPAAFGQSAKYETDIRKGLVYRRVPHVTLKSIANNEEIDAIHAKWQEKLEPVRAKFNKLLKKSCEEWELPREADAAWPKEAKVLFAQWWDLRRQRQKEIDASIASHAETEILYDQPYEDNKRVRVSGPFTMESLSPHRVLSAEQERPASEKEASKAAGPGQFETMILDNLKKAGVQNTVKKERLVFDRLETYAGVYLHAEGEFTENGKSRRAAVCIGPEHGTVGPELVKEAAKGIGFDLLVICGFAFDPHVSEETKQYGKLTVLTARMNPDLAMGNDFLKKTGAGNLFMVFGEPDMDLKKQKDGKFVVEIEGVDVFDPTTGQIRSHSTDDIACWFIDTDYNGESFFVRHAYFCGADEPYEKLKRALRAEIDESAWSSLYSTKSRSFDPSASGKIAIKVINHYGDEVLKVYDIAESQRQ